MTRRQKRPAPANRSHDLRQRILEYFQTLRISVSADELDAVLAEAEKQQWNPLELLAHVFGPQADLRRQRAIERRIREARFREPVTLEGFDWDFNAPAIDRRLIETLATGEFIRRGDNLVIAGQSGVGKSRILQSVGRAACAQGYRVRYITSAELLHDLTASLAATVSPSGCGIIATSISWRLTNSDSIGSSDPNRIRPPASCIRSSIAAAPSVPPPW